VILDDEEFAQLDGRLVQTSFAEGGLLDRHVDRAITMLGGWASVAEIRNAELVRPDGVSEEAVHSAMRAADGVVAALLGQRSRRPIESLLSDEERLVLWQERMKGCGALRTAPPLPRSALWTAGATPEQRVNVSLTTPLRWDDTATSDPLTDIRRSVGSDQGPTNRIEAIQAGVVERMLHDVEVTLGRVTPGPNWQAAMPGRGNLVIDLPDDTLDEIRAQHPGLGIETILALRWEDLSAPTYRPTVDPVAGAIVRPARMPPDSLADVLAAKQCGDCGKGVVEAYGYHAKGLGSYVVCEVGRDDLLPVPARTEPARAGHRRARRVGRSLRRLRRPLLDRPGVHPRGDLLMARTPPKRLAQPAAGFTVETEPDDVKAARILGMFRWMIEKNQHALGLTIGNAQFMVIRYRPKPYGPHNPEADLSGVET
jgi:hypothetical protein